ncbi:MFS transporter [Rhizobium sp. BK251]|uniref:MFS transporter n=1 Tax=Rhizobium sp. BK251 TaxID=2512125 RepID=UPI0010496287|nr:MFS transporter [Rhizobium sp. BK251]TCL70434.1 putative MFS family arabinose efflux permease [Rhizobium sp. BK251]
MLNSTQSAPLPPAFKRIGWSNLFAQFSEQIALAAAPLAAVLLLGAGPVETGWLQMAQTLPFLLLSIPAGLAVDRASRKTLMVGSEVLRSFSLIVIVLLLVSGLLNVPLLAVLGFIGAVGTVCYSVAAPAIIPSIVPRARLGDANRWLELVRSAAFAAGPALGGALVGWTGASTAYVLATVLSILAALYLASIPKDNVTPRPFSNPLQDLKAGATFVAHHKFLLPILFTAIFFNTAWVILIAVFVAYAVQNLGMSATQVGIALGVDGVGMIVGAMIVPVLARRFSVGTMIVLGPLGGFCGACLMLLTLWFPSFWLVCISFFVFGVGPILWSITTMTLRQAVTPNVMLGRVSALIMTATYGSRPLGAALGALVAGYFGVAACLFLATGGFLVQFLIILLSPVPGLRALPVEQETVFGQV